MQEEEELFITRAPKATHVTVTSRILQPEVHRKPLCCMFTEYCHLKTEGARLQGWLASERGLRAGCSVAERRGGEWSTDAER